jgi:excisionase family DNA binding protein
MPKLAERPSAGTVNSVGPNADGLNGAAILTKKEAAELLRCTPRFLERQVRSGRLKALKPTGKFVRFRRSDIDAFLEAGASISG